MDTFHNGKKVACPASADFLDPLAASYKLHFTTAAQIAKHGVCRKCRKRMKEHGAAILAGKVETPGPMVPPPAQMPDGVAWQNVSSSGDGQTYAELTPTCNFDFDALDEALGFVEAAQPSAREQAGELVRQLFAYCFKARAKVNLKTAAAKFAMIGAGLRPDDALHNASQTELAAQLGLTKAAMSKASVKFQSAFAIKFARSRSLSGRAKMRAARLAQHGVNRNKPKAKADTGHPTPLGKNSFSYSAFSVQ